MFYLSRRQTRAAMSAAAGAAVYLAASEIGARRLKLTGLFVLASASMAGMVAAKASAKAYNVEARLNSHITATAPAVNLVANGGTIGGSLTVSGDHTVTGNATVGASLFGNSGHLPMDSGTKLQANGGFSCSGFTLTMNHGDPTTPGGAPLSYSAAYETNSLRDYTTAVITGLSNSGVFQ